MQIDRRTLLRGAGTVMALPFLEAMMPQSVFAQSPKAYPLRMAYMFFPNGAWMQTWTPTKEGTGFDLPWTLEPLAPHMGDFNVLTGLTQHGAEALGDGGGDHARSAAAWLTGCHPRKTSGADIKGGLSADQLAAMKVGGRTRFPSLELGIERGGLAGDCDSGYSCAYSNSISWRSENTPVAKETDPRLVFERLFGGGDANETAETRATRLKTNKSILDFVQGDMMALKKNLGGHDRLKLDEYFTSVREIENRIAWSEKMAKEGGAQKVLLPGGLPTSIPSAYHDHVRLMSDIMILALQTDMTRIVTFMLANEGSNRAYNAIGIKDGHHENSHHGKSEEKQENYRKINRHHVEQLAYVLTKMKSIKEGDSTLLDNTMLVYGGGISDGDWHNHNNLPIILAGKGRGTIKTGRHIKYADQTPMNNLHLSMLDRMGVPGETLGDSTGKLGQLF
jgi:Protein of unknown function (DUF1552)